jgi:hypothetical protein
MSTELLTMPKEHDQDSLDLVWGADNIATAIRRTLSETYTLLERGHIPCARKIGKQWCVSRRSLAALFNVSAAA